jgi:hypothetical protein
MHFWAGRSFRPKKGNFRQFRRYEPTDQQNALFIYQIVNLQTVQAREMSIVGNFWQFCRDWTETEKSVIERTRLEIYFRIIFVLCMFELGGRPGLLKGNFGKYLTIS